MKKPIKWIIAFVVITMLILILLPIYRKHILVTEYENMLDSSITYAINYYEDYKASNDAKNLELLASELYTYQKVLLRLEEVKNLDEDSTNSLEVNMAISVLQGDTDNIEGFDKLYGGLKALQDDVYSDIGYSQFLEFYNQNAE